MMFDTIRFAIKDGWDWLTDKSVRWIPALCIAIALAAWAWGKTH